MIFTISNISHLNNKLNFKNKSNSISYKTKSISHESTPKYSTKQIIYKSNLIKHITEIDTHISLKITSSNIRKLSSIKFIKSAGIMDPKNLWLYSHVYLYPTYLWSLSNKSKKILHAKILNGALLLSLKYSKTFNELNL